MRLSSGLVCPQPNRARQLGCASRVQARHERVVADPERLDIHLAVPPVPARQPRDARPSNETSVPPDRSHASRWWSGRISGLRRPFRLLRLHRSPGTDRRCGAHRTVSRQPVVLANIGAVGPCSDGDRQRAPHPWWIGGWPALPRHCAWRDRRDAVAQRHAQSLTRQQPSLPDFDVSEVFSYRATARPSRHAPSPPGVDLPPLPPRISPTLPLTPLSLAGGPPQPPALLEPGKSTAHASPAAERGGRGARSRSLITQ